MNLGKLVRPSKFMAEYVSKLSAVDQCTCLSTLSRFVEQNPVAVETVEDYGLQQVTTFLASLVCDRWFELCVTSA